MQVVWEANTADFAKRKRAAKACASCQKRKKRCPHTFTNRNSDVQIPANAVEPLLTHKDPVRFVGDLNPESILTDLSSRPKGSQRDSHVGTWVDRSLQDEAETSLTTVVSDQTPYAVERYSKVERGRRTLSSPQKVYLQAVGAFRVLPTTTQDVLVTTYISSIDGLLPLLDGGKFLQDYTMGTVSPFLVQAVCLLTCKTEEAAAYLNLTENGPLMDPIPFARVLHTGLDAAMKADLEPDRLTKVQILALMSLHNDGPGGLEESSMHLSQAIHEAHSAGLHIHTSGRETNDTGAYVWWCLWVMDKINSCLGGVPIMIADRDIGLSRPPYEDALRTRNLLIWLALADLLADVICLYRPMVDQSVTGWEEDFPSFEKIVSPYNFDNLQTSHKNIHELFYNAIAVLSCRTGDSATASYERRRIAGDKLQTIMAAGKTQDIAPFPLVPYAVSLSLTVAYRMLRDNIYNEDASRDALAARCAILESLGYRFRTADAMAKLGRRALMSLDRPIRDPTTARLAQMFEPEMGVCKYINVNDARTGATDNPKNALDVLSSAAAAHGGQLDGQPAQNMSSNYIPSADEAGGSSNFQDLDLLFDDFFDLGMPTFFSDAIFDGMSVDNPDLPGDERIE